MMLHYINIPSFPYPLLHEWIVWLTCTLAVVSNTAGCTGVYLSQLHIAFFPFMNPQLGKLDMQ